MKLPLVAALFAAAGCAALPSGASAAETCPGDETSGFTAFAHRLLDAKDPQGAYETYAAPDMVQKNPPFGAGRSSTVKQWQTMTGRAESHFDIVSIQVADGVGTVLFRGRLGPGAAAEVTQHDRLRCGRIVEEWAEFRVLGADDQSGTVK